LSRLLLVLLVLLLLLLLLVTVLVGLHACTVFRLGMREEVMEKAEES